MIISPRPKIYHFYSSQERAQKTRKIIGYLLLVSLVIVGIVIWQNQLAKIKKESNQQITQAQEEFYANFKKSLENSGKNSFELVSLGRKMLEKNLIDAALVCFERATEIDQNYRDAYFYLGYSYLKIYENEQSDRTTGTVERLERARDALIKARDLDPLYGPTYQFFAYTYNKLGDEKNAELWYNIYSRLSR